MALQYLATNNEFEKVSRYQILRVITNEGQLYLETQNQRFVPLSDSDEYHIVNHSEVNRLDKIAYQHYGRADYWWAIALANNMIDPFVVNEGVMLRVPSVLTLSNYRNRILVR